MKSIIIKIKEATPDITAKALGFLEPGPDAKVLEALAPREQAHVREQFRNMTDADIDQAIAVFS